MSSEPREGEPIAVRLLAEQDSLSDLTALLHRAYAALLAMGFRYVATWQDDAITARRAGKGECYVGWLRGAMVATLTLVPPGRTGGCPYYERAQLATVHQFAVEPALQGRGIGSRLLAFAEDRARRLGAREIALDTAEGAAHLLRLYESRGYRAVERVDWPSTNYVSVILAKDLREAGAGDAAV
ncbi:MAG: GNAT family N-acetyltransferase [Candidatus Eisenbacteria bacterium]|nr:GNAT family N-acetyltransferase [Candidatus Eisenbacteria bacterium]